MSIEDTHFTLTEDKAVYIFAKAWNRLEPESFLQLLSEEARYASQWVFEELVGVGAISDYLRGKMRTVQAHGIDNPGSRVRVEVGQASNNGRPCALMSQGRSDPTQAAMLFEIKDNAIIRCDLCIPQVLGAVRVGIFPI